MKFSQLIAHLSKHLQLPLPGIEAQKRMLPVMEQADRFDKQAIDKARPGAVLIVLYPKGNSIYFPLIRRPVYSGAHSGQIALPGGKVDKEDKDFEATALREAEEEIAVNKNDIKVLGHLTELFVPVSNFNIFPFIGYINEAPELKAEPREVAEIIEADILQFFNPVNYKQEEIKVRSQQFKAPYFDYQGHMIWGATAMILSEFYEIIKTS
jgi:8-oxo-dGTP pyrophosphatase MutT (NUDIX family)